MKKTLENVAKKMEYPGRFLILGKGAKTYRALYGVTARSEASKAKRYVWKNQEKMVFVQSTDKDIMAQGDLSLLDYTAAKVFEKGIVIGNGQQIDRIQKIKGTTATFFLQQALEEETYESDAYCTPRITGCFLKQGDIHTAALHSIMVGNNGEALHNVYDLPIEQDRFYFLSTYAGPNIRPTPSFVGDPISVDMPSKTLEDMVTSVFDAWSPYDGGEDLRVSVVGLSFSEITQGVECCIKNRF